MNRLLAVTAISAIAIVIATPGLAETADAADAADAADVAALPNGTSDGEEIVVTGEKRLSEASAGTKTNTPIVETPQSISVVTNADIAGLGLQNLSQALRFVAGVTPEQRGASAEVYDLFSLRGFGAPVFLDGLFYVSQSDATGYAAAQADVSRLERVEIIKGPSSALYGRSGPGGLVVQESKLPLDRDLYGAAAATYGTFDLYRVDGDVGGRLSKDVLWRAYGSVNGAHSQQRYGYRRRYTGSGAITVGAGSPTTLTVLAAYSHDPRNSNYGVFPAVGTLYRTPQGRISQNFYGGEPDDFFFRKQAGITYILKHDFGGGWSLRSSGRYQYVRSRLGIVYTAGAAIDPAQPATIANRGSYSTSERNNNWVYDNQLAGHIDTGPLRHDVLLGADRQVLHFRELASFGTAPPINPFAPVYGTVQTPRTPAEVPGGFVSQTNTNTRQQGVYVQDQISLGGLHVTASGRHDWARAENGGPVKHDRKFTYRVGGLYRTEFGLAPYVSYSTSFQPQSATLIDGTLADPSLGKQIEGGLKYQPPGTQILVTAAYFHIKQTNVLTFDPVSFAATQSGKVRSKGVEVEAKAPLPYGFNAALAFSRQRVKVLEDQDPVQRGHGLPTVGRGGVSANLEWAPQTGAFQGFGIGGAVRYVDRVYAYGDNNTPSYTLFDGLARLDLGRLSDRLAGAQLQVNAMNIFNKRHLTSCFVNYNWCWYGNRRTVQGTLAFKW